MKKIIILMLAGIGDSLLATPMLTSLRKMYPDAHISVLVMYDAVRDTLLRNKDIDEVIFFDFMRQGYWKSLFFALRLRKNHYDLSILAYPANRFQHNFLSFVIGARRRIAHLYDVHRLRSLSFLETERLPINAQTHTIDENLKLLTFLDHYVPTSSRKMTFSLTQEEKNFAENYLKERAITKHDFIIGIHAGSSELAGMTLKRWPAEKFAQLCDRLIEQRKAKILLFGGNNEIALKQEIADLMTHKPLFVNSITFFQSVALISRCSGFICNDTGLMHLASFFNIPTVVVTGHINPIKTQPLHHRSRILVPDFVCKPYHIGENLTCLYQGTPNYCLNRISVDDAYRAFMGVLS